MNANQKMKHCPVCGAGALKASKGNLEICAACKVLPETEQYDLIQSRIDASLTAARALCSEAYKAGDRETVWVAQASIKELERQKERLRKPEGKAAGDSRTPKPGGGSR